ncbi:hypothetical protein [Actinomyces sp. W5033]|uniref:hypothetical protein n=1 Tax=Actinomyces sp. W5033 TaxID=3446479 RepID=UPI003EE32616
MTNRLTLPAYLVASAASLFGNAAIGVVLPWLVLERTGDPALGVLGALFDGPVTDSGSDKEGFRIVSTFGRETPSQLRLARLISERLDG